MENGEIGRVKAGNFTDRRPAEAPALAASVVTSIVAERALRRDVVELTDPHRAVLRLLRERILQNTRQALELPRRLAPRSRFVQIPSEHPRVFFGRLLSDQNLLASARRGQWAPERVDRAIESGLVQGTSETAEILFELGDLDADTWRLIVSVLDEYYRKLSGIIPEEIRAQLWDEL